MRRAWADGLWVCVVNKLYFEAAEGAGAQPRTRRSTARELGRESACSGRGKVAMRRQGWQCAKIWGGGGWEGAVRGLGEGKMRSGSVLYLGGR